MLHVGPSTSTCKLVCLVSLITQAARPVRVNSSCFKQGMQTSAWQSSLCPQHTTCGRRQTPLLFSSSCSSWRRRRQGLNCRASSVAGSDGVPTNAGFIPARRLRTNWPDYFLSREEAVQVQLRALRQNDQPHKDFGVEVLYRFSNIDLLSSCTISSYFGRKQDLGRFELFRWIFNEPPFGLLLDHVDSTVTSSLQLSDTRWAQRVAVTGAGGGRAVFEFAMSQRCGGRKDGIWFCDSLMYDATADLDA